MTDPRSPAGPPTPPIKLDLGAQRAVVALQGGRLVSYAVNGRETVAGVQSAEGPFAYRGSLLAPWPNRIAAGRWSWAGQSLQLDVNEPAGDAALHGLATRAEFVVEQRTATGVELEHALVPPAGYPFRLLIRAGYLLGHDGLQCFLEAINLEDHDVPVGLGVHTYVAAPGLVDDLVLTLPAQTVLGTDEQWRETGRSTVAGTDIDFRSGRPVGDQVIDTSFTDLLRTPRGTVEAVVGLPDGAELVLWSGATCRWLVVYSGDTLNPAERRRSMAVEPMTCPANAFVSGDDLDVLAPGGSLRLDWGLRLRT